jgi:serine/threonine-protein kinase
MRRGEQLGKYQIRRRIAAGSFATVYEAWDIVLGMSVAVKVPHYDDDHDLVLDEVKHVMGLEHENVLPILNVDYLDGLLFVVSPLGKESLREQMLRGMDTATVLDFSRQMLAGLAHAHERGLVHCDVKPENLIVFGDGRVRLCDFGLAKSTHHESSCTSGTVGYLAPEQALGRPTQRSDVFAAGLVIWEFLTGELPEWPFEDLPGQATVVDRCPALLPVLKKAMEVDERERYASAGELLEAFVAAAVTPA